MRATVNAKPPASSGLSAPGPASGLGAEFFIALALVVAASVVSLCTAVTGGELLGMFPG